MCSYTCPTTGNGTRSLKKGVRSLHASVTELEKFGCVFVVCDMRWTNCSSRKRCVGRSFQQRVMVPISSISDGEGDEWVVCETSKKLRWEVGGEGGYVGVVVVHVHIRRGSEVHVQSMLTPIIIIFQTSIP